MRTTLGLVAAVLLAAPARGDEAAKAEKPRLIVLELASAGGVEPAIAGSLSEAVAAQVEGTGLFAVTSSKDVATLLGMERQKALLGCTDASSACMAELTGALGARFVLSGSLARLGEAWQLNLQTIDANKAQTIGRSTRIASDLPTLRGVLPWAVAEATATPAPPQPSRVLPYTLMGAGAAAVVAGSVLFFQAAVREDAAVRELQIPAEQPGYRLKPQSYYATEADGVRTTRIIAGVAAGAGVALAVAGVLLNPKSPGEAKVALVPTFSGAALVGVWP